MAAGIYIIYNTEKGSDILDRILYVIRYISTIYNREGKGVYIFI